LYFISGLGFRLLLIVLVEEQALSPCISEHLIVIFKVVVAVQVLGGKE
jgi:hypothetical protein